MPRAEWALREARPCVQVVLTYMADGKASRRVLLADTGAGSRTSGIDLILPEDDCVLCGGLAGTSINLRGAFAGSFPLYNLRVQLPELGFVKRLRVAGVPTVAKAFDGIACFSFLSRFTYGNCGNPGVFCLEL